MALGCEALRKSTKSGKPRPKRYMFGKCWAVRHEPQADSWPPRARNKSTKGDKTGGKVQRA